jgi:hypothetical protein
MLLCQSIARWTSKRGHESTFLLQCIVPLTAEIILFKDIASLKQFGLFSLLVVIPE